MEGFGREVFIRAGSILLLMLLGNLVSSIVYYSYISPDIDGMVQDIEKNIVSLEDMPSEYPGYEGFIEAKESSKEKKKIIKKIKKQASAPKMFMEAFLLFEVNTKKGTFKAKGIPFEVHYKNKFKLQKEEKKDPYLLEEEVKEKPHDIFELIIPQDW